MKLILAIAATLVAFSARASDHKLGNVIAVEREITNIYDTCLQSLMGDTSKDQSFFYCGFSYLKSSTEVPVTKGGMIRFSDDRCRVDADAANGFMSITFGRAAQGSTTNLETAKVCLQRALQNQNSVKVLVYTME